MSYDYVKIADFCHLVSRGKTPKYDDNGSGKVVKSAHVQIENIRWENCPNVSDEFVLKYRDNFRLRKRDVLLNGTGTGTLGRPGCVNEEPDGIFILDSHVNLFRVKESKLFYRFLFYWLLTPQCQREIERSYTGSTNQIELSAIRAGNLSIPLPPLEEQKRIAAILDKADRIRRKRQEAIRLTEELGRSIFLDMFGDPVTNPKGWDVNRVIDYCDCIVPARDKPKSFTGKIPWITTADLNFLDETYISNINMGLSVDEIKKAKARMIPKGSVLLTCVGDLGVTSIAGCDMVVNQQLHTFQCQKVNNFFLMYSLPFQKDYMRKRATQTTLPYMNKTSCNSIPIIVPPRELQDKFGDLVSRANKGKELYNDAMQKSENLFNSLLQRAFRGEL